MEGGKEMKVREAREREKGKYILWWVMGWREAFTTAEVPRIIEIPGQGEH